MAARPPIVLGTGSGPVYRASRSAKLDLGKQKQALDPRLWIQWIQSTKADGVFSVSSSGYLAAFKACHHGSVSL